MNLSESIDMEVLISSVILIGLFSGTLIRIFRGSRLVKVATMVGLLLLANMFHAAITVPFTILIRAKSAQE